MLLTCQVIAPQACKRWYRTDISSGSATRCVGPAISVSPTDSLSGGNRSPESRV
jgi:hypothetical protein